MKVSLKYLRLLITGFLFITAFLWIISFEKIFFTQQQNNDLLHHIAYLADMIYYFALPFFALIILIKAQQNTGNLMFASFLLINSLIPALLSLSVFMVPWIYQTINTLFGALFSLIFLKTFQFFPKPVTPYDIRKTFRPHYLQSALVLMLDKRTWIIYPLLCIGCFLLPFELPYTILYIMTLVLVTAFLYANSKKSKSDRNKVTWLLWGICVYLAIVIIITIFEFFDTQGVQSVSDILSIVSVVALLFAFVMSLFFSDTFDTGVIIKRTIINSFIFICIIFIYNAAEHYFLHWISHKLHISDVLLSSIFSGILVMFFSPLHHKLMHFLELKLKGRH